MRIRFLVSVGILAAVGHAASPPTRPAPPAAEVIASAKALMEMRRLPEAREPLEALVKREPENMEALLLLASVYDGLGRHDEAVAMLEPSLKTHGDDPRLVSAYAGQCMLSAADSRYGWGALRRARAGRDAMERAVTLNPREITYREALVNFYREAPGIAGGSMEKALQHAGEIAKINPSRGAAAQVALLIQERKYDEAFAACDAALATRPDDYLALFILGHAASETGKRLADGETALRRCLAQTPAAHEPGHASAWYRLGLIAEKRGDTPAARRAYAEAVALAPEFSHARQALARLDEAR